MRRREFLICIALATTRGKARDGSASGEATPDARQWRTVFESIFPHPGLKPELYHIPASALLAASAKDAATAELLASGWQMLNRLSGGAWMRATARMRRAALAAIQESPFFALLRQTAVYTFYGNQQVWNTCGYEGDAWSRGGYAGPHLVTIDWLPAPPAALRSESKQ